jgi:hypothetical protein
MVNPKPTNNKGVSGSFNPTYPINAAIKGLVTSTMITLRAPIMVKACNQHVSPMVMPVNPENKIQETSVAVPLWLKYVAPVLRLRMPMTRRKMEEANTPLKMFNPRLEPCHNPSQMKNPVVMTKGAAKAATTPKT